MVAPRILRLRGGGKSRRGGPLLVVLVATSVALTGCGKKEEVDPYVYDTLRRVTRGDTLSVGFLFEIDAPEFDYVRGNTAIVRDGNLLEFLVGQDLENNYQNLQGTLDENPFSLTPDPRFLFLSGRHREGIAHLIYGMGRGGGFVQLTGEVGTGKTTLYRSVLARAHKNVDVALILNPCQSAVELLASICDELHVEVSHNKGSVKALTDALNEHLLSAHSQGRRTILVVDEAQNLSPHEVKTIVSRAGKNTKIVLTGDPFQIDSPYLDSNSNGLSFLVEAFNGRAMYGHITLESRHKHAATEYQRITIDIGQAL